ncbi:hypothetical protein [Butyrivibrio sp. FCS014]|nr:hypothetical protein [Butyrivibrio sp. FCS014]
MDTKLTTWKSWSVMFIRSLVQGASPTTMALGIVALYYSVHISYLER